VLPHPDALTPFAPITYNGPVSGNGGLFLFASFDRTVAGVSIWVLDGNTGQLVPYPASFPANVPFSVAPSNLAMPSDLNQRLLNHGLTRPLVDPCEDDNPQGFRPQQIPGQAPNGRTYHHRRHHLVPRNQDLTSWWVPTRNGEPRLLLSTPIKTTQLPQPNGGVLTIDYLAYPSATAPPFVSTVLSPSPMPPLTMTQVVTYPTALPGFPGTWDHCNVLSDLSPNVRSSFNPSYPTALAWIAGRNRITDVPSPGIAAPPPLLVLADHAAPGTLPSVTVQVLQSPLAPYAERVLVWNDLGGATPLAQHLIVPCRDGVEIYDPAPPGPPGTPPALVKVVAASAGKEICTDVSYFGPSPYDDTPPTPYFIVLERTIGEMQGAGGGVNFLVFDLLPGSGPARGPTWAAGTLPGLSANFGRGPMDVVRGLNDIAVAPPRRDASGGWDPFGLPAATAWFGVWDADTAVTDPPAQLPFGAMVGVENTGLGTYQPVEEVGLRLRRARCG
jgi:hypothetical protein